MFIFSEEKRPKLKHDRPDFSESELTRNLARMWNDLPEKKKVKTKKETKKKSEESLTNIAERGRD